MERLDLTTPNFTDENIQKLSELFPNCVTESTEGKTIDFDLLRQELSSNIVEGNKERYQLTWPGKAQSLVTANTPINKTLRPVKAESKDFDNTENLYIEGDNLEVLKLLQETYLGKIKMIYIDPPYNTGNDFVYKDNFTQDKAEYDEESGNVDEEGGRLVSNPDSNGRYHSDWLSMMYPRLKLARNLLKDDGVIFISIDDNEVHNLRRLCDEVFSESNFINQISINTKVSAGASGGGEDKKLKKNIEYILMYTKSYHCLGAINPIYKDTKLGDYIGAMKKEGKSFKYTNILYSFDDVEPFKTIKDGKGDNISISKVNNYEIKTVKQVAQLEGLPVEKVYSKYHDKIMTTTNAQTSIRSRVWEATDSENNMYIAEYVPKSGKNKGKKTSLFLMGKQKVLVIWLRDTSVRVKNDIYKREKIGTFWDGFSWINVTKEGNIKYPNGKKPIALIERFIQLAFNNEDAIVLDFFSGSSSVAHAVMQYNISNFKHKWKTISVQIPETIEPNTKDNKDYLKYLEKENIEPIVTEIGKERIRRAGEKIKEDNADKEGIDDLDIGFRVLKVDSSNMKDVHFSPDNTSQEDMFDLASNIKDDRTDEDLLFMVLLDWGVDLSVKIERREVAGKTVYFADDNFLAACFEENLDESFVKALASENPLKVVLRDSGFASSSIKINVEQIFKQADIEVKVI